MGLITQLFDWYAELPYGESGRKMLNSEETAELLLASIAHPLCHHIASLFEMKCPPIDPQVEKRRWEQWEKERKEAEESEFERRESARKAKNRAKAKVAYRDRKARQETRVTYNPRFDGLATYSEAVWSDFMRMKKTEPVLPPPSNTIPARVLPQMPEEPRWGWDEDHFQYIARRKRYEEEVKEIRRQDAHDRDVAREREVALGGRK